MSDFLVIGGGLIGMLTARELRREGADVTLLERGEVGRESSWAGGGILSPLYPWRYAEGISALVAWSQKRFPALAAELLDTTGIDPEWTQSGLLILDGEEREPALEWTRDHGVTMEVVTGDAVGRGEPVGERWQEAIWLPDVAQVRNPRLLQAMKQSLLASGVRIEEHNEVLALNIEGGRISGVKSTLGDRSAGKVVVASGAWSAQLLQGSSLNLALKPVRGQMIVYHVKPALISRILLSKGCYVIPRRDGHLLVGSTVEKVGFDKRPTAEGRAELEEAAARLVPLLSEMKVEHHWAGLRPGSAGGIPFIDVHPFIEGLYINAGQFRNGVAMGPASARLLTDIMLDRPPIIDPAPFSLDGNGTGSTHERTDLV